MAVLLGSLSTSPVASDPEEEDGLKACLAQQSRKQRGADIHPQPQSPAIILIFSPLKMQRLNCCAGS